MIGPTAPVPVDRHGRLLTATTGHPRLASTDRIAQRDPAQTDPRETRTLARRDRRTTTRPVPLRDGLPMAVRVDLSAHAPTARRAPVASGHRGHRDQIHRVVQRLAARTRRARAVRQKLAPLGPQVPGADAARDRSRAQSRATRDAPPGRFLRVPFARATLPDLGLSESDPNSKGRWCPSEVRPLS